MHISKRMSKGHVYSTIFDKVLVDGKIVGIFVDIQNKFLNQFHHCFTQNWKINFYNHH